MPSFNVSRPSEPGGNNGRRLPYLPAIDGLRAIAVLAVVLYHAAPATMPGGFFGVDVFFVISGYLITSFLWSDWKRNRDLGVKQFWFSRARRLLPAVAVLICGLLLFAIFFLTSEVAGLRDDALAAAAYVTNWYLIVDSQSYFESFGRPSLLRHLWSLAIEEQFYLLWPLVLFFVLPRFSPKQFVPVIVAVAIASWVLMAILYEPGADPSRVYYGTDTRAGGLLIGAAMAFIWNPWETARPPQPAASLALNIAGLRRTCGHRARVRLVRRQRRYGVSGRVRAGVAAQRDRNRGGLAALDDPGQDHRHRAVRLGRRPLVQHLPLALAGADADAAGHQTWICTARRSGYSASSCCWRFRRSPTASSRRPSAAARSEGGGNGYAAGRPRHGPRACGCPRPREPRWQ